MTDLKVVEFTGGDVNNFPQQLRKIADEIESGSIKAEQGVYVLFTDKGPVVYGHGAINGPVEAIGILHVGTDALIDVMKGRQGD